jgi:proteasome assembly chaperone (PAC2) family protein
MTDPLQIHATPTLRSPVMVLAFTGWNDAGESASTAVRYLARHMNAEPLATIDPEEFYDFTVMRPHVRLVDGVSREVLWLSNDFSSAVVQGADRDLVVGLGPEPHLRWRTFCEAVIALARRCEVQMIVTLGGFLSEVLYSRPVEVSGFSSDPELIENLGLTPSRYEGPTGIVGVLGDACRREKIFTASLWASLPHYIAATPNPRGALALLLKLRGLLGIGVDLAEIESEAADFENKVNQAVAADPKLSAYVRELKKREFAH